MRAVLLAAIFGLFTVPGLCEKPAPVTERPVLLEQSDPEYTEDARKAQIEGSVHLSGIIGVDGRLSNLVLVRTLSHGLGDKAIECARKWKFKPATRDGAPVAVKATVQVPFRLSR